ncbi:hypothetical protein G6F70_005635 [Rhizopus microsporus]|nr:hypothetical protein G6F71_005445 [Rhizopus microsporus]KAG1198628.1 hypothetical protein G6F70_005635 [Rhizopus microsporus]KAG1210416.1 hypothetical protein G6F69_005496 [Rhizopus microsporus]
MCAGNDRFPVTKIDFSKFTNIHYAFAIMTNRSVPAWEDPQKANAQLTKLVTMAHKHKVKVLPSIGGWTGSITFSYMAKSQKSRKNWEYPGRQGEGRNEVDEERDVKNFLRLLRELRQAIDGEFGVSKKEISAAVYIRPFNSSVPEMAKVLDRANIMTYDMNGPWNLQAGANAPLYAPCSQDSIDLSVNAWIEAGMPRHKITVGLGFYGRSAIAKVNMLKTKKINRSQVQGQTPQGDKTDVFFQSPFCPLSPGGLSGTWRFHNLLSQHALKSPLEANKPWVRVLDAVTSAPWLFQPKDKENNSNNSHHKNAMTKTEHEVISIKNRVPIKSIRIERDYSLGDGITRFYTNYPEDLQGRITPEQFKHTIEEVNRMMDYADRLSWKVILENIMETLTIYLWPVLFSTHYQRAIDRLHTFIDSENQNLEKMSEYCPVYAPFFGTMGCAAAIVFSCLGAAYGTAKSGVGLSAMGVLRPDLLVKCIVPVVMAGILGIYGVVVSVLLSGGLAMKQTLFSGFVQMAAGLSVGLSCLAAGIAIGITGDAGVRATAQQPRMFVGMILILIFAEVLGLYGLIVALILNTKASGTESVCN